MMGNAERMGGTERGRNKVLSTDGFESVGDEKKLSGNGQVSSEPSLLGDFSPLPSSRLPCLHAALERD